FIIGFNTPYIAVVKIIKLQYKKILFLNDWKFGGLVNQERWLNTMKNKGITSVQSNAILL
ncbi:hypothetical protein, partial [Anoxybacillus kestanbolensis]|uniref:hypothetical protein n=1 Tax=Anoxybacillus kestanbolensis TaxID=227476 RepID=UPI003D241A5A